MSWRPLPAHRDEPKVPTRYDVERAVERSGLPAIGRHIILVLCQRMVQGSTVIMPAHSPSLTTLARGTGWNRTTIARHLNVLEQLGWVIRQRPTPYAARARHARTSYTVLIPDDPRASGTPTRPLVARGDMASGTRTRELVAHDRGASGAVPHKQTSTDKTDLTDQEIDLVIAKLAERTGVTVSREHAAIVRKTIQSRPGAKTNPHAYLIRVLVADPRPRKFLETEGETPE